ncbi:hypothetical protein KAFR_0E01150 [Kazachstania africana CBS 2517]|uniref:Phosphoribulokinase/uridine kinase domain-containing protein n=1 Tax=Kazachstania africana (strain ATCC 22294 / BCRC 22015 / CBS 2517 / CECT 1963 / NBRC 1671 / NRRL Y-8276) TaxID=1071382 RepID=H2AV69_KAZAF|nr:hypothetical protein KAFR_0E01150 [Kazachstania africana CBS 2517]CCF58269.1 hypothetical protein KAFR_0E01150 [Kazachstania africana CBS 2517]
MIGRIIVSIGGGHATGVAKIATELQEKLSKIFTSAKIRIIDLDELVSKRKDKTYSEDDYDFEAIYEDINEDCMLFDPNSNSLVSMNPNTSDEENSSVTNNDPVEIVLLCGCYALYDANINRISQLKVFLDSDNDKRLINLIHTRNVQTPEELSVLITEYMDCLRPEMEKYIEITRKHADLIIPSSNESVGSVIILDGIVKVIEQIKASSHGENFMIDTKKKILPLWDFEAESLDLEKSRYYDLS